MVRIDFSAGLDWLRDRGANPVPPHAGHLISVGFLDRSFADGFFIATFQSKPPPEYVRPTAFPIGSGKSPVFSTYPVFAHPQPKSLDARTDLNLCTLQI